MKIKDLKVGMRFRQSTTLKVIKVIGTESVEENLIKLSELAEVSGEEAIHTVHTDDEIHPSWVQIYEVEGFEV